MHARSTSPGHRSSTGSLGREMSSERTLRMQAQGEMSPENVRDRVLSPKRYNSSVSKLGDARSCITPRRNVEKMFTYFSDHAEQEQLPERMHRQNSRENLYRTHCPPPEPSRVRSSSAGRPRTADGGSQYSGRSGHGSFRDGNVSDRSSQLSARFSASSSPPKMRGSTKWAVPGHGHMALWGNVTQVFTHISNQNFFQLKAAYLRMFVLFSVYT
jgi:hypothetical protein